MKHLLFLIALVFGVNCYGQKDTIAAKTPLLLELITLDNGISLTPPKQDTVKVLMLVCDTLNPTSVKRFQDGTVFDKSGNAWWQFGYEVGFVDKFYDPDSYPYKEIKIPKWHLDQNKKPLPKSIIVWMTKEIKP